LWHVGFKLPGFSGQTLWHLVGMKMIEHNLVGMKKMRVYSEITKILSCLQRWMLWIKIIIPGRLSHRGSCLRWLEDCLLERAESLLGSASIWSSLGKDLWGGFSKLTRTRGHTMKGNIYCLEPELGPD
jgi:hypothetical protein